MSRRKRGSKVIDKAQRRIAALKSISPTLDLGNGVTIDSFAASSKQRKTSWKLITQASPPWI